MADADSKKEEKAKTPLPLKIVQIYFLASYFPGVGVMSRLLHVCMEGSWPYKIVSPPTIMLYQADATSCS